MWSLHGVLHFFIVSFGITFNVTAIYVILFKTHNAVKEYSLLLLNASLIELSSILAHFLVDGRLFIDSTSVFAISDGPCLMVSQNFCAVVNGFMNTNMIYSVSLLCLSFWYRTRILREKGILGRIRVQLLAAILFLPHPFHIASFVLLSSSREQLHSVLDQFYKPTETKGYGLHGFVNITERSPALIFGYLVIIPLLSTIYIVFTRRRLIRMLREKMRVMSVKTHEIHESFNRVLTIHAVSSLAVVAAMGILSGAQMFFRLHSVNIEGLEYDVAVLPALINPALTLYFVRAYRLYVQSWFMRATCETTKITTITIQHSIHNQRNSEVPVRQKPPPAFCRLPPPRTNRSFDITVE